MSLIYIGDSHLQAIKGAMKFYGNGSSSPLEVRAFKYRIIKNGKEGGDIKEDELLELVTRLNGDDFVICAIGGNQHHIFSLVKHPVAFDVLPDLVKSSDSVQVIPSQQIKDLLSVMLKADIAKLGRIYRSSPCRVLHLPAPPPKANEDFLKKYAGLTFKRLGIDERGITPAGVRLKIWQLQCELQKDIYGSMGVDVLPLPPEACDEKGFLREPYYAEDATHANIEYGRLILEQVRKYISKI